MKRLIRRSSAFFGEHPLAYAATLVLILLGLHLLFDRGHKIVLTPFDDVTIVFLASSTWAKGWQNLKIRQGSKNIFVVDLFDLIDRKPKYR